MKRLTRFTSWFARVHLKMLAALCVLAVGWSAATVAGAELIENGKFETYAGAPIDAGSWAAMAIDLSTGWSHGGDALVVNGPGGGGLFPVSQGGSGYSASPHIGAITQVVTLNNGQQYSFSYWTAGRNQGAETSPLTVSISDGTHTPYSNDAPATTTYDVWTQHTATFTATFTGPYTVSINYATAATQSGSMIDTVSLTSGTEPSALSLTLASPTNGASFSTSDSITATGTVANGTAPYTVKFYTNSVLALTTNSSGTSFTYSLGTLAGGTYEIYASVTDDVGSNAVSTTNTFHVVTDLPPVISITSPTNNATFASGASIAISATASDDGSVTNVAFYGDGSLLGSVATAPYTNTWSGAAAGAHTLEAVAWDNTGHAATSAVVNVTVLPPPPVGVISVDASGAADVSAEGALVSAYTSDPTAQTVNGVTFNPITDGLDANTAMSNTFGAGGWNGGIAWPGTAGFTIYGLWGSPAITFSGLAPNTDYHYQLFCSIQPANMVGYGVRDFNLDLSLGGAPPVTLGLAYQNHLNDNLSNAQTVSTVTFNTGPGTTATFSIGSLDSAPIISAFQLRVVASSVLGVRLVCPTNGQSFSPYSSITATATVANGTAPCTVQFHTNSAAGDFAQAGADVTNSPYEVSLGTLPAGTYHVYATVTDGASSNAVSATNTFCVANQPPSIAIVSPAEGDTFVPGAPIGIVATATDDGSVTNVSLYADGRFFANAATNACSYTWRGAASGAHVLTAVAWDNDGLTATSAVNVAVSPLKCVGTYFSGSVPAISTNFGRVVAAVNIGGTSLTRDGISFAGWTVPGGSTNEIFETDPLTLTLNTTTGTLANGAIGGDALFETEVWDLDGYHDVSLLISGLTAQKTYQVQYLHGDTRVADWGRYNATVQTLTDSASNQVTPTLAFNTIADSNQYAILTVQVSGATSLRYDMPACSALTSPRGPSFSGVVVLEAQYFHYEGALLIVR